MVFYSILKQAVKSRGSSYGALSILASTVGSVWAATNACHEKDSSEKDESPDAVDKQGKDRDSWVGLSIPIISEEARVYCSAAISADDAVNSKAANKVMAPSLFTERQGNSSALAMIRRATLARMNIRSTKQTLESKYEVNPEPIGEGAFGQVFVARDRQTGELVAVKKIWKEYSNNQDFVREMNTLLQIQAHGGHPHICQLRENFDEPEHFALVLDLIKGGEMFEHLVESGAYSELDGKAHVHL